MKNILILVLLISSAALHAQQIQPNWEESLKSELEQFKACEQKMINGINACNPFIGQTLQTVYQINDFYAPDLGRHLLVSEIFQYLKDSKQWTLLGHGYEQKALNGAQANANASKAAVAVYLNQEGLGFVSLILPGEMKISGTWGCQVPNSAAFFIENPEKSYVGKGLSYSFDRKTLKEVLLFGRNY